MIKKLFLLIILIIIFSCSNKQKHNINELFKLKIGFGENEIGFIPINNSLDIESFDFVYKNGFFYITDPVNNKILKITEKGDPVLIIYNKEFSQFIETTDTSNDNQDNLDNNEDKIIYTKLYKNCKIYYPHKISVDDMKNIYIVHKNKNIKNLNDDGSISEEIIIKFNNKGEILFNLGTNGIGSSPFKNINNLFIDNNNNLLVLEKNLDGFYIYKFSENGQLIKKSKIMKEMIPLNQSETNYIVDITNIKFGFEENEIYFVCHYVKEIVENMKIVKYETAYEKILKYSLLNDKFERLILKINLEYSDISKYYNQDLNILYGGKKIIAKPMSEFIGISDDGLIYLSQKNPQLNYLPNNDQTIIIYNNSGRVYKKIELKYPDNIQWTSPIKISNNNLIYFLYVGKGEIYFAAIY